MTVYQTPGPVDLHVEVGAGRIDLVVDDVATTTVELHSLSGESGERAIAATEQTCSEHAGGYAVRVRVPRSGKLWFGRHAEVAVRVVAPAGTRLLAETASADVAVRGTAGGIDLRTASGDVHTGPVAGDAAVRTMSGDVELGDIAGTADLRTMSGDIAVGAIAGEAALRTMSGDVTVARNGASANVSSMSGDVRLDALEQGDVEVKSASGDITVGVVTGTRVWMDVQSTSGEASSELDHTDGDRDAIRLDAPLQLRLQSVSGDVRIRRSQDRRAASRTGVA
jgi:DUF4097 and DUF4098 domain-containing protein YvlB